MPGGSSSGVIVRHPGGELDVDRVAHRSPHPPRVFPTRWPRSDGAPPSGSPHSHKGSVGAAFIPIPTGSIRGRGRPGLPGPARAGPSPPGPARVRRKAGPRPGDGQCSRRPLLLSVDGGGDGAERPVRVSAAAGRHPCGRLAGWSGPRTCAAAPSQPRWHHHRRWCQRRRQPHRLRGLLTTHRLFSN